MSDGKAECCLKGKVFSHHLDFWLFTKNVKPAQSVCPIDEGPANKRGLPLLVELVRTNVLVRVARRKHQRFYRDRYDFRDPETFADVDVVQIADFDTVYGDDVARDLEFIFQHTAKRFGYIEIQCQIKRAFWIISILENRRDSFCDAFDRLRIRHTGHGQRQGQTRSEMR